MIANDITASEDKKKSCSANIRKIKQGQKLVADIKRNNIKLNIKSNKFKDFDKMSQKLDKYTTSIKKEKIIIKKKKLLRTRIVNEVNQ